MFNLFKPDNNNEFVDKEILHMTCLGRTRVGQVIEYFTTLLINNKVKYIATVLTKMWSEKYNQNFWYKKLKDKLLVWYYDSRT